VAAVRCLQDGAGCSRPSTSTAATVGLAVSSFLHCRYKTCSSLCSKSIFIHVDSRACTIFFEISCKENQYCTSAQLKFPRGLEMEGLQHLFLVDQWQKQSGAYFLTVSFTSLSSSVSCTSNSYSLFRFCKIKHGAQYFLQCTTIYCKMAFFVRDKWFKREETLLLQVSKVCVNDDLCENVDFAEYWSLFGL
jgi:hypothetical protein